MTGGVGDGLRLGIGGLHLWRSTSYNMGKYLGMEYGVHDGVLVVIHIFSPCSFPGQRKKEKKRTCIYKRGGKKTNSQKL